MTTSLRDLKEHVDCRELIEADLGPPAYRSRDYWQWSCVFHSDGRTPSLTAWTTSWFCFGCGAHGDAIAWVMERRGLTFKDAVRTLGGDLSMPERRAWPARRTVPPAPPLREPPSRAWRADALRFVETAHEALLSPVGERARAYLHGRGITDDDIITWKLGYVPQDQRGVWGGISVFAPRSIAIPHFVDSEVWGVKFRRPQGDPKYICAGGSVSSLYGTDLLQGKPDLLLAEGEFDAILLRRLVGDVVDVATFGSASDKDVRLWLPTLIRFQRIFVGFDTDPAGQKAAAQWLARTKRARLLPVPEGFKDWTDAWRELGDDELRRYILEVVNE